MKTHGYGPRGQYHKTFLAQIYSGFFCKLDHHINAYIIFLCCGKVQILKGVSKFMPKKFYEIDSSMCIHNTLFYL
jgi:hypothetical protein